MSEIIKVKNLTKEFTLRSKKASLKAVNKISFNVNNGEMVGFIGPNGAGKSTTIKMLTGILFPTEGRISVLGMDPQKQREELSFNIGTVFGQKPQLWHHLPPIDTFHLFGKIYEIDDKTLEERLNRFVDLFEIRDFINTPVRKLSLGQRMRCEIVVALLHNPKIIFLDEPTIGLDIIAKRKIRDLLKKLNEEEGTTVILTSHDMQDIEKICKRIIIINKGKIVFDGDIKKIKKLMGNKIVELYLDESNGDVKLPKGVKLVEKEQFKLVLEVNVKKMDIPKLLEYFFKRCKVADLIIKEIPIEEIIEDIYEN
jgi:ABC-2 type transport system ATP-binding protein